MRHPDVAWTGCTNELTAGYAAEGYGRLRGIAALCTTFGVGELSAINAVAGSYAEHVPVVHVVGWPAQATQDAHRPVHHTLGDGGFGHFLAMHESITCACPALTAGNATADIDRVFTAVCDRHLPGYLLVPADVVEYPVSPPAVGHERPARRRLLHRGDDPVARPGAPDVAVLAGLLVHRLGATDRLAALLQAGRLPHATSVWAKSPVDESAPAFVGTYAGAASAGSTRAAIEDAAALIIAGVQFTDLNSGMFTHHIDRERTIELGVASASVGAATLSPVELPTALVALTSVVSGLAHPEPLPRRPTCSHRRHQPLWASIGYTLPALLGAGTACPGRRGVVLIGDGAAQMTVQELGTILRERLPALVVVVDNDGYIVERAIHGPDETYTDIGHWDWTCAPALFGRADVPVIRAAMVGELRAGLEGAQRRLGGLALVQAVVLRDDIPELLGALTRVLAGGAGRTDGTE